MVHGCYHVFCRRCILAWCRIVPACPLCKRAVTHLVCDIRSDRAFSKVPLAELVDGATHTFAGASGHRWRRHVHRMSLQPLAAAADSGCSVPLTLPAVQQRAREWLRRELQAVLWEEDVALVEEFLWQHIARGGLSSAQAAAAVDTVLGATSGAVLLRDLLVFLRSGLTMEAFDRAVRYEGASGEVVTLRSHRESAADFEATAADHALADAHLLSSRTRRECPSPACSALPATAAAGAQAPAQVDGAATLGPAAAGAAATVSATASTAAAATAPTRLGTAASAVEPARDDEVANVRAHLAAEHALRRRMQEVDRELAEVDAGLHALAAMPRPAHPHERHT